MIYDAVVAGGGLAGSAVAIALARAGRQVILLERETGPHDKVCGEFLSFEATRYLTSLGIAPASLGAVALHGVRLVKDKQPVTSALPFQAASLSRRVLDEALLMRAIDGGVTVKRGVRVKALALADDRWIASVDDGAPIEARAAFLATGKHDLKDLKRGPGTQGDLIGFKMYWHLAAAQARALEGHVELALFPGGYAGLQPVEDNRANLCLLVRRRDFSGLENSWEALLENIKSACPHLAERLNGAAPALVKPLAISAIPYGFVFEPASAPRDGLWRLGDQAAVIPSFSGDGMSIALHSAQLAAHHFLAGARPEVFQAELAHDVRRQIRRSTRISQALVRPWGQSSAAAIARLVPPVLTGLAMLTRIPKRALARSQSSRSS